MGNWNISIQGIGAHHNNLDSDADKLSKDFVKLLKKHGHTVEFATFTFGGKNDIAVTNVDVTINGKQHEMADIVSYEDISKFVGINQPTITYKYPNGIGGILMGGHKIVIVDGMRFTAVNTGDA